MEITEIRIKLVDDPQERLQAFCSITIDGCFVVRDLKIIQGTKGSFVAMPSRKLTDHCPTCRAKNPLRSRYCSDCGRELRIDRAARDLDGRAKLYADIAHPIHADCRDHIQARVIDAYYEELERAKSPDYVCLYDDYGEDLDAEFSRGPRDHEPAYRSPRYEPPSRGRRETAGRPSVSELVTAHPTAAGGGSFPRYEAENFGDGLV